MSCSSSSCSALSFQVSFVIRLPHPYDFWLESVGMFLLFVRIAFCV